MMKSVFFKMVVFSGLLMIMVSSLYALDDNSKLIGTWNYNAKEAPYEYSIGQLIFTEDKGDLKGKIKIGTYEIEMKNLKKEGKHLTFNAYIEGEYISIKITPLKNTFSGTASYSDGTIAVTGEKDK